MLSQVSQNSNFCHVEENNNMYGLNKKQQETTEGGQQEQTGQVYDVVHWQELKIKQAKSRKLITMVILEKKGDFSLAVTSTPMLGKILIGWRSQDAQHLSVCGAASATICLVLL